MAWGQGWRERVRRIAVGIGFVVIYRMYRRDFGNRYRDLGTIARELRRACMKASEWITFSK